MKALTLRLPDDLYEKLRWLAFKERCTQHSVIIAALKKALKDVKVPKEVQE